MMKEMNKKQEMFYDNWLKHRNKKWKYVFIHGSIYWGIPTCILSYLINNHFNIININWLSLIINLIVFMIAGIGFGLWSYNQIDNAISGFNNDAMIEKGIIILKTGESWDFENLTITKENDEKLIVKNNMYWFDDKQKSSEHNNECFNMIKDDFNRLKKNKEFKDFSTNMKVKFQIYDNSENNTPLIEEII